MPQDSTTSNPQLRTLPDYWRLDSFARAEVSELSDKAINWTWDRWGWSIKQQASHIASVSR
jgi:hypothetical protein